MSKNIKDFLDSKLNSNVVYDNNGEPLKLYHGTNRKFSSHSVERNRTVLNDNYQGDWICYSPDKDIAWDYAEAARNQCFDKNDFLQEMETIFSNISDNDFYKEVVILVENVLNEGYSNGWDKTFDDYEIKHNLEFEEGRYNHFWPALKEFEKNLGFDIDEFLDVLGFVEYSKSNQPDEGEVVFNMFNLSISKIPDHIIEFLEKLGFDKIIPEPKIIESHITASNILKTSDREEARKAKENGYDLVIYDGEGTVKGVPEYLIANPEQVKIQEITIKEEKVIERDLSQTVYDVSYRKIKP